MPRRPQPAAEFLDSVALIRGSRGVRQLDAAALEIGELGLQRCATHWAKVSSALSTNRTVSEGYCGRRRARRRGQHQQQQDQDEGGSRALAEIDLRHRHGAGFGGEVSLTGPHRDRRLRDPRQGGAKPARSCTGAPPRCSRAAHGDAVLGAIELRLQATGNYGGLEVRIAGTCDASSRGQRLG